jgi:hypothetical protein
MRKKIPKHLLPGLAWLIKMPGIIIRHLMRSSTKMPQVPAPVPGSRIYQLTPSWLSSWLPASP